MQSYMLEESTQCTVISYMIVSEGAQQRTLMITNRVLVEAVEPHYIQHASILPSLLALELNLNFILKTYLLLHYCCIFCFVFGLYRPH